MSDLGSSLTQLEEVWTPSKVGDHIEINAHLCSMCLINVRAFLEREEWIGKGKGVYRRAKVLEFGDNGVTDYAIRPTGARSGKKWTMMR